MELNGEPKELKTQRKDASEYRTHTQQREKKSESEKAWRGLKQA